MKTIKTNKIILFLIVLAIGLASASCNQPTGDQLQVQKDEAAAEAVTSFDAVAQSLVFNTKDSKCTDAAVVDIFLKLEGIDGESTDADHKEWIDILAWSYGVSGRATSSLSGRGTGKANVRVQPFVITKPIDNASPGLRRLADSGETIAEAALTLRMICGEQQKTAMFELEDVMVSSYSTSGASSSRPLPTESVTLNYEKISLLLPAVQVVGPGPIDPPRDDK